MPAKLKTLLAAAVLGGVLGVQAPLWVWGLRTGFTFEDSSEAAPAAAPEAPAAKWLAKTKISALWLPEFVVAIRLAGGIAAIIAAYALSVLAALRAFRLRERSDSAAAASGGVLVSLLAALHSFGSGAPPTPFLSACGVAAALLGAGIGYRLARLRQSRT